MYLGVQIKEPEVGRACVTCGRGKVRTGFWWGNLNDRDHFEDIGMVGTLTLKWIFKYTGRVWSGLSWTQVGTSDGSL